LPPNNISNDSTPLNYYSTQRQTPAVSLREAVVKGLPADNGLFMPEHIPSLPASFFEAIDTMSFQEMAFQVADALIGQDIDRQKLQHIVYESLGFEAPLLRLNDSTHILELFHGPTLAFKDFGARFMARLLAYYVEGNSRPLHILVATSGDTGSAVAHGFLGVPNIRVSVLYPKGKVSLIQEKQFTTLGQNITAIEIDGTFDDCQSLVKQAFLDKELNERFFLSSANSINLARLIPQMFYYFRAYAQAKKYGKPIVFVVPSGNFGNLTAGLIAKRMGLPVSRFVAATNMNKIVPDYLAEGEFKARPSVQTISNAMDVGNPSNFARMKELCGSVEAMRQEIKGYFYSDEATRKGMAEVRQQYGYVIDPHGAVGYLAWKDFQAETGSDAIGIILETAHPSKFLDVVEDVLKEKVAIPSQLAQYMNLPKLSIPLAADFATFKKFLFQ
jgi:threonine synthase